MNPEGEPRRAWSRDGLTKAQGWIFTAALAMPGMTLIALAYLKAYLRTQVLGLSPEARDWVLRALFVVVLVASSAFNGWLIATTEAPEGRRRKLMIKATIGNLLVQPLVAVFIYAAYFHHSW
jgi:hypothetical protein